MLAKSEYKKLQLDWLALAALSLAVPVIAMTSLFQGRLPGTHDAYLHLLRLLNAAVNIKEGVLLPRWGPQLHFGFGYPLGNYYAPGWHIPGGMLVALGLPAVNVLLLFQAFGLLLYPLGGYLYARLFVERRSALLGGALCLFAPLRFYEVFIQGNVSQLIAVGLIVWVLWAFARCALVPSYSRIVVAGALLAALFVTHHPTSAYMAPFTALYAVFVSFAAGRSWLKRLAAVSLAFGLALLLSAFYWLPALLEVHNVNVEAAADQYALQDNFVMLRDLLGPVRAPDRGSLNMPFSFSIGQIALALGILGGLIALWPRLSASRWQRAHALAGLAASVLLIYLVTYRSLWLWQDVPKAHLILFPWRLLGLIAVTLIPGAVFAVSRVPDRWRAWVIVGLLAALLISFLPLLFPLYANEPDLGTVTPATGINYEITSGNLGAVSNNEYLPKWAAQRPDFLPCPECYQDWEWEVYVNPKSVPAGVTVDQVASDKKQASAFKVTTADAFVLELHQMYFPGWRASLDGRSVAWIVTQPYGLMAVNVPAGTHEIEVWYAGTRTEHVANTLSLCGLLLSGGFMGLGRWRHKSTSPASLSPASPIPPASSRLGQAVVAASFVVALLLVAVIKPQTGWFRHRSSADTPLGMSHRLNTIFTDSRGDPVLELLGYTVSQTAADYGDWINVRLFWRALQPLDQSWAVKVALSDPATQAEWAINDQNPPGGFPTTSWPLDKYVIDDHILRIDSAAPPYVGNLVVQVYAENARLQADNPVLTTIRLTEQGHKSLPDGSQRVDVVFGGWLRLRAYDLTRTGANWELKLYWQVLRAPGQDCTLMLHLLTDGQETGNVDQPPIPSYAPSLWRKGQYLTSTVTLPVSAADTLYVGLYNQSGRLPVRGNLPSQDGGLLLPLPSE